MHSSHRSENRSWQTDVTAKCSFLIGARERFRWLKQAPEEDKANTGSSSQYVRCLIVFDVFQSDNDGFGGQSVSKAKKDDGDLAVKDPILIIGGGLGGLTVLEGEPSFGAIGYCI